MAGRYITRIYRPVVLGFAALLGAAASGPALAQDRGAQKDDSKTCASFGLPYASPGYVQCMLSQQGRRDDAPLRAAEQQRLSAETARSNVEMVRRMRCEREAKRDRQRGERPQWCG